MKRAGSTPRRIALFLLLSGLGAAAAGQTFTTRPGAPAGYVLRDGKRFFAIGTRVDGIKVKPVDENTFTSIREIFNTLWITIRDIDDPKHLYPDGVFTSLSYLRHDEGVFLAGDLPYRLQTEPGCIIDVNRDGVFQPSEQRAAHRRVAPAAARRAMEKIHNHVNPAGGPNRSMIYYLMDEPDAGYATDHHWAFTDSLLKRFYDQRRSGTLAYIDLGPVTGSKFLYEKRYPRRAPDQGSARYFASLKHSFDTVDENVRVTSSAYAPAADILGINSYDATNRKPSLLGEAVGWIQESSGYKPVWPWVSAEQSRYTTEQSLYSTVRPQLFSAIVHGATGILFYNDQTTVAASDKAQIYWDRMFDLAKEVGLFRTVLEEFTYGGSSLKGAVRWRAFQRSPSGLKAGYYFVVNATAEDQTLQLPGAAPLYLGENACGVWLLTPAGKLKALTPLQNLSFEVWRDGTGIPANWRITSPSGTTVSRTASRAKLGSFGLLLDDDSSRKDRTVRIEQSVPCAPGESYALQAWCRYESGTPQILSLEFRDDAGGLLREESAAASRSGAWQLVRAAAVAPAQAETVTVIIASAGGRKSGRSCWDDALLRIDQASR